MEDHYNRTKRNKNVPPMVEEGEYIHRDDPLLGSLMQSVAHCLTSAASRTYP